MTSEHELLLRLENELSRALAETVRGLAIEGRRPYPDADDCARAARVSLENGLALVKLRLASLGMPRAA